MAKDKDNVYIMDILNTLVIFKTFHIYNINKYNQQDDVYNENLWWSYSKIRGNDARHIKELSVFY